MNRDTDLDVLEKYCAVPDGIGMRLLQWMPIEPVATV